MWNTRRRRLAFLGLFVCVSLVVLPPATVPLIAQQPSSARDAAAAQSSAQAADAAARTAQQHAEAAERAKTEAANAGAESIQTVRTVSAEMIGRAQWLEKIASLTIWFFGIVATLAGVTAAVGVGASLKKIVQSERRAAAAVETIDRIKAGMEQHHLFLKTLEEQVSAALGEIEKKLAAALTPAAGLIGVELTAAVPQRSYDDDALIVFADRLRIAEEKLDARRMSAFLVMMSNYWRRAQEYGRAIERAQRAIELDSASPAAHKAYGRALWNRVAEEMSPTAQALPRHLTTLNEAATAIDKAGELLTKTRQYDEELAFDRATIARLSGDNDRAEREYRQGLNLSQQLARSENREADWDFAFGLACLFAVNSSYQAAFDQLKAIVGTTKSWRQEAGQAEERNYKEWALADPDFRGMLADREWRRRLEQMS
jgi:hypothetical protein